jgi:putative DNA primase/helicase
LLDEGGQSAAIDIPDADPLRLAFFEQSDLGNAERLKALAGGKLKWIEDLQAWAWYDGKRFDVERGAIAAQRLAHEVVRHIRIEARRSTISTIAARRARATRSSC